MTEKNYYKNLKLIPAFLYDNYKSIKVINHHLFGKINIYKHNETKNQILTKEEFYNLPEIEKNFTHLHFGVIYLYSSPERYVNHSSNPNTLQDLKNKCDIAIRDIKKGEEITTDAAKDDI